MVVGEKVRRQQVIDGQNTVHSASDFASLKETGAPWMNRKMPVMRMSK